MTRQAIRRVPFLMVMVLLLSLVWTGLGFSAGPYAGSTIKYMAVAEPISDYIQKEIIPAFTKETGINVQIDTTDYVKLHDKEVLELIAQRYDVYQIDQFWASNYAKNKWLASLDPYVSKYHIPVGNYYQTLMKIGNISGQQYVLPLSAIPVDYYYHKKMLAAAGIKPPDTWDEVLSAAKALTKSGQWGIAIRGERGNPITWTFLPIFWAYGGKILDDQMHPVYNSKEGVAAVEFFKELNHYSPPGWHSAQEVAALMQQGQAAQLTLMSVYNAAMDDPAQSKVVNDIVFAEMPKGPTGKRASILGLWTIGIGEGSKNKDAAAQFLAYLSRVDVAKKMAFSGTVSPTMPKVYQDPSAPRFYPVLGKILNYVQVPPLIPESEQWFLSIGTALQEALSGEKTPQQAMDASVKQVDEILKKAGYYK
jgi:multiple sugar transport system substrate-binding protein